MPPKPIHELTAGDLRAHRIWVYATGDEDEVDETYVRPEDAAAVPGSAEFAVFHVACTVVTALGARLSGFMSVCEGELQDPAPVVVGEEAGYFPLDCPPTRREALAFEQVLGAPYAQVFPVQWHLLLPIEGEQSPRSGSFTVVD